MINEFPAKQGTYFRIDALVIVVEPLQGRKKVPGQKYPGSPLYRKKRYLPVLLFHQGNAIPVPGNHFRESFEVTDEGIYV
jgi:hypothetical protein